MRETASQVRVELREEICAKCREQIIRDFGSAEDIDYVLNYFCHNCTPESTAEEKIEHIELILDEPHAFGLTPENEEHRKEYALLEKLLEKLKGGDKNDMVV